MDQYANGKLTYLMSVESLFFKAPGEMEINLKKWQRLVCLLYYSMWFGKEMLIGRFRIPRWPGEEHDCEANAGQRLCSNKNKHS